MSQYIISNELYHHGILGQKWGVRKYQNEDGTLTSAGKTRYWGKKGDRGEYKPVTESSNRKEFDSRSPRDMSAKEMQIASQYYNNYANYLNSRSRIKDAETPAGVKALKNAGRKVGDDVYKQLSKYIIAGTAATAGALLAKKMKDVNWSSLKDKIMSGANAAKSMVSVVGDMVPRNYTTLSIGHADFLDGINFSEVTMNYLIHHGIQGQKWGLRRYQNEDGSLTPEGKARYAEAKSHATTLNDKAREVALKEDERGKLDKEIYSKKSKLSKKKSSKAKAKIEAQLNQLKKSRTSIDNKIKKGQAEIDNLVNKLRSEGFAVSKERGIIYKGTMADDTSAFVRDAILYGPAFAAGALGMNRAMNTTSGFHYTVKGF